MQDISAKMLVISKKEKRIVSYHEIGHALGRSKTGRNSAPVHKITIVPRTSGALGLYHAGRSRGNANLLSTGRSMINKLAHADRRATRQRN